MVSWIPIFVLGGIGMLLAALYEQRHPHLLGVVGITWLVFGGLWLVAALFAQLTVIHATNVNRDGLTLHYVSERFVEAVEEWREEEE